MDLRQFYKKVREVEASLAQPYVMVTSLETSEGGRQGVVSEVGREVAAMLIVGAKVALATESEVDAYRKWQADARAAHEKAELAKHLQVTIISDADGTLSARKPASK
ncbi:MAG: hypothetical protein WBW33_14535 [Bryobacteraceae bacterium]